MSDRPRVLDGTAAVAPVALIAESDAPVKKLLCTLLARAGYNVIPASSGAEALTLCGVPGVALEVAIVEIELPDMRGTELAQRLRAQHPALPVVFIGADAQDEGLRSTPPGPLVAKPFHPADLIRTVKRTARAAKGH